MICQKLVTGNGLIKRTSPRHIALGFKFLCWNSKGENMYKVKYLGHSGFVVETENHLIIFDYVKKNIDPTFGLRNEIVQTEFNIKGVNKDVIFLNSHDHFDHYNKNINKFYSKFEKAYTVVGDIETNLPNTKSMKGRDYFYVKGAKIYSAYSTDEGVCFVVDVDGVKMYFAGDNIDWGDPISHEKYYREINYLAEKIVNVDIAFVPVCNFYGEMSKSIVESAIFVCEKLKAKEIYPMHSPFGKNIYKQFELVAKKLNCSSQVVIL